MVKQILVDCWHDDKLIRAYDFGATISVAGPVMPPYEKLIGDAKTNLTNEGLAFPPYDGITFRVRYP